MAKPDFDPKKIRERFDRDAWGWKQKYRPRKQYPFQYNSKSYRKKHVLQMLGNGRGLLLDLGCGPGTFFESLRSQGYFVVGADFSHAMASLAHEAAADCAGSQVVRANALSLPFRDGSFDGLIAVGLLEYFPEDVGVLREIRRILKPGGRVVLTVRNKKCVERRLWKIYAHVFRKSFAEKHYYREHDPKELEEVLAGNGFENITKRFSHFYPLPWPFSRILRPLNSLLGHPMELLFSKSRFDFLGSVLIVRFEAPEKH
jgi:SAM-dependent methyltransferase